MFGKLFSFLAPPKVEHRTFPLRLQAVPGLFTIHVHRHVVASPAGPVPCLTYVTDGFLGLGHREIAFTLKSPDGEPMPEDPVTFLEQKFHAAKKSRRTEAGDQTIFGGHLLGFKSVLYVHPQRLEGVPQLRLDSLAAVGLFAGESEAVAKHGPIRVMSALGRAQGVYPCPPWSDRDRAPVLDPQDLVKSRLDTVVRIGQTRSVVMRVESKGAPVRILLRLMESGRKLLADELARLAPGIPLALLTSPAPDSDSCLTWKPGQEQPDVFLAPGSRGERRLGSFLMVSPGRPTDAGSLVEDGYALDLTAASWERFKESVARMTPLDLPGSQPDAASFSVEWVDVASTSLDREVVRVGSPLVPVAGGPPVVLRGTVYATPGAVDQAPGELGVELDVLLGYQSKLSEILEQVVGNHPPGPALDVHLDCELKPDGPMEDTRPARPQVLMKAPPADPGAVLPKEVLFELFKRLSTLDAPRTKEKPLRFVMVFAIHGGAGLPMPVAGG